METETGFYELNCVIRVADLEVVIMVNINEGSGHVTQGKVGDDVFMVVLPVVDLVGSLGGPGQVVLRQHHALGVAGGARGVDQGARLVGRLVRQPLVQLFVRLSTTNLKQSFP